MDLILWRHAEAEEAGALMPDLERRLTPQGEKQAKAVARWFGDHTPKHLTILASPALRTVQTAQALAQHFEIDESIGPGAETADLIAAAGWPEGSSSVLLVGHQPVLGRLAALLLSGHEADWTIRKGALWWFSGRTRSGENQTVLRAVIAPDLL